MDYRLLDQRDPASPKVSVLCLGTMTWGEQNTEAEAHEQLDYALEQGVNFIDTAEVYPVPIRKETHARTETYIGRWLAQRNNRDRFYLATKVAGPSPRMNWLRGDGHRLDRKNIVEAVEASLKRLQTDYIDLYQLHWPERTVNIFGERDFEPNPDEMAFDLEVTLSAMDELVRSGKVRFIGLSNETPWGIMRYLEIAREKGLARPVSVQNVYSLLNRSYEISTSEVSIREKVGLLAYSPLAMGTLSGKYLDGAKPPKARLTLFPDYFDRYEAPEITNAVSAYVELAKELSLTPAQLALAFVNSRPFVTSNIIGATTLEQLKDNLSSAELTLSAEAIEKINAIHARQPNPVP